MAGHEGDGKRMDAKERCKQYEEEFNKIKKGMENLRAQISQTRARITGKGEVQDVSKTGTWSENIREMERLFKQFSTLLERTAVIMQELPSDAGSRAAIASGTGII